MEKYIFEMTAMRLTHKPLTLTNSEIFLSLLGDRRVKIMHSDLSPSNDLVPLTFLMERMRIPFLTNFHHERGAVNKDSLVNSNMNVYILFDKEDKPSAST